MVKIRSCWLLVALILLPLLSGACGGDDDKAADSQTRISISGAFALYPMMQRWTEAYSKLHSDVRFDVSAGGAGKGMSDVLAGAVDIAMVSREIRPEESDQGAKPFAVAKDAVVAVVNADNPALDSLVGTGLTPQKAAKIWLTGEITTWNALLGEGDSSDIHVYTRADAAGAAEVWAIFMGGKAQEDLKGIGVQGDPGLAEAVRQDALGIGYNNIGFAYDPATGQPIEGLRVVPIDLNRDGQITDDENFYADKASLTAAIADGCYPSPPARVLYVVTKDQPNQAVIEFIRWILTDGQAYVDEAGYVQLADEQLQAALAGLGEE